ncbi:MAG TPA: DUF2505 family protein [Acidimicrobiia bacterium]|nr:DUF2505 family protein [Acidimicrobiia bacterium]
MARLTAEHRFSAPRSAVEHAIVDPAFYEQLRLPDVAAPEVLSSRTAGSTSHVELRMAYTGRLDPVGQRVVGDRQIAWIQRIELDVDAHRGVLRVELDGQRERVQCRADMTFAEDDDATTRSLRGDLSIKVPLVGGLAERKVLPGVLRRLDLEAEALRAWLAR